MADVNLIRLKSIEIFVQGCERGKIGETDKELVTFGDIFR